MVYDKDTGKIAFEKYENGKKVVVEYDDKGIVYEENNDGKKASISNGDTNLTVEDTSASRGGSLSAKGVEISHKKDKNGDKAETAIGTDNVKILQKKDGERTVNSLLYENDHGTKINIGNEDEQGNKYTELEADIMNGVKGGISKHGKSSQIFIKGEINF